VVLGIALLCMGLGQVAGEAAEKPKPKPKPSSTFSGLWIQHKPFDVVVATAAARGANGVGDRVSVSGRGGDAWWVHYESARAGGTCVADRRLDTGAFVIHPTGIGALLQTPTACGALDVTWYGLGCLNIPEWDLARTDDGVSLRCHAPNAIAKGTMGGQSYSKTADASMDSRLFVHSGLLSLPGS
jgi:hypothetical protein